MSAHDQFYDEDRRRWPDDDPHAVEPPEPPYHACCDEHGSHSSDCTRLLVNALVDAQVVPAPIRWEDRDAPRPLTHAEHVIILGHYPYQWDADAVMTPITLAPGVVFDSHIEFDGDYDDGRMVDCSAAVGSINGVSIDMADLRELDLYAGFQEQTPRWY